MRTCVSAEGARGRDRDDRPALRARLKPGPDPVKASLRGPRDRDRLGRLSGLAVGQGLADPGCFAVVPRRFDQQPPGVRRPGLVTDPSRRLLPVVDSDGTRTR